MKALQALFRWVVGDGVTAPLAVQGSGQLGLGEEDSVARTFTPVPLPSITLPQSEKDTLRSIHAVFKLVGREHVLLTGGSTTAEAEAVLGFGDNVHGQLAAPDSDGAILAPQPVLLVGQRVGTTAATVAEQWVVRRIRDIGAGVRHSVFLVDVSPA